MRKGSRQVVSVDSKPAGAIVRADPGERTVTTPGQLLLARRYSQRLTFDKEGYQPATVILERKVSSGLWLNLLWIHPFGWIIGFVVDLTTGSGYELEPGAVSVDLEPIVPEMELTPPGS
jgi:hypothetical protein